MADQWFSLSFELCALSGFNDDIHVSCENRINLYPAAPIRLTRLTNAFSKKIENHVHALSIYFMHYNFVRIHQSLRVTPAMAAGVTDRLWELEDVVKLADLDFNF
jgi:hypothetical protein